MTAAVRHVDMSYGLYDVCAVGCEVCIGEGEQQVVCVQ